MEVYNKEDVDQILDLYMWRDMYIEESEEWEALDDTISNLIGKLNNNVMEVGVWKRINV